MKPGLLFLYFLFILQPSFSQKPGNYSEGLAPQKRKGDYGFVDNKSNTIISYQYDTIYKGFRGGFAVTGKGHKAGVIDKKGKVIVPFEFLSVGEYRNNIIPVENVNNLWGFYSYEGKKLTNCLYDNFRIEENGVLLVQLQGKWGAINLTNKVLLDFNYKEVSYNGKDFWATLLNKWTLKNFKNETLGFFEYDSVRNGDGAAIFIYSLIGNYGLCDNNGKAITQAVYDHISRFKDGLAIVKKKNEYGIINTEGKIILPIHYKQALIDSVYLRAQEWNGKWTLLEKNGMPVLRTEYLALGEYSEGLLAAMEQDSLWGYITIYGQRSTLFRFTKALPFKNGMAEVEVYYPAIKKGYPAVINKKGNFIITPEDYKFYKTGLIQISRDQKPIYVVPKEGFSAYEKLSNGMVLVKKGGNYGVITTSGKEIISPIYDYISHPSEGGYFIVERNKKTGVINSKGEFMIKPTNKYEKILGFHEGLSKFIVKGRYGLLDTLNNVFISPQYPKTGEFSNGLVAVVIRNKWGFMDKNERLKVQPYYDEVWLFKNGAAKVRAGTKYTIVNNEGRELHPLFEEVQETFTGRYLLRDSSKYGLADRNGREILAPKYDQIIELGNGYVKVERNGLWGILNYNADIIIPLENEALFYDAVTNTVFTVLIGKRKEVKAK